MAQYITKAKDTWDIIAKNLYGDEFYSNQLIDANFMHACTVFFEAGITLNVPEVKSSASATNLPPWR